jgi:hypothetical protein
VVRFFPPPPNKKIINLTGDDDSFKQSFSTSKEIKGILKKPEVKKLTLKEV